MKYKIKNCKNNALKKAIGVALKFYSRKLMHPNLCRNIYITVIFAEDMRKDEYAECYPSTSEKKPRNFVIRLRQNAKSPLLALSHEMVHVKQYAKQELCIYHTKWKNTSVSRKTPYKDLPWEKQAYKYDYTLYQQYKSFCAEQLKK